MTGYTFGEIKPRLQVSNDRWMMKPRLAKIIEKMSVIKETITKYIYA